MLRVDECFEVNLLSQYGFVDVVEPRSFPGSGVLLEEVCGNVMDGGIPMVRESTPSRSNNSHTCVYFSKQ